MAGAVLFARPIADFLETSLLFSLPGTLFVGAILFYGARPIRKVLHMGLSRQLAGSSVRLVKAAGVYMLLRVAYRFWPQEPVTDFVGMQALHEVYDQSNERTQAVLRQVLARIAGHPGSPLAPAAHDFLTEVAPADIDAS